MQQQYQVLDSEDDPYIESYCDLHSIHYSRVITSSGVRLTVALDTKDSIHAQLLELWDFALDPISHT
jgi:hypothetical protein